MYFAVQELITAATKVFHTKAIWKIITNFSGKHFKSSHWRCSRKKRCSYKFNKIHRKTPVLETLAQVFSQEFCKISKNTFCTEHLRTTAAAAGLFKYL